MERRGRIPIAKFRTQEGKTRSRSRVREPDYNEQDPETDLFTLLEDNIALKEANKALKSQVDESNDKQKILQNENNKIIKQFEQFKEQHEKLEKELTDVTLQLEEVKKERNKLNKIYKMGNNANESDQSLAEGTMGFIASPQLKSKLLQILRIQSAESKRDDIDLVDEAQALNNPLLTIELIEKLIDEFLTLKTNINAIELQLYEANEKMSDLLENQQHLEHDNEVLRSENLNLTKVAKLLTDNMKESVETSKKMEAALIKLKQRNDELTAKNSNGDRIDGLSSNNNSNNATTATINFKSSTSSTITATSATNTNINVQKINNNSNNSESNANRDHGERVVEMQNVIETFTQTNIINNRNEDEDEDDELKNLKLKLSMLEAELHEVRARAQLAETELEKYKLQGNVEQTKLNKSLSTVEVQCSLIESEMTASAVPSSLSSASASSLMPQPRPMPPPPPPPMPKSLLYKAYPLRLFGPKQKHNNDNNKQEMATPNTKSANENLDDNTNCSISLTNTERSNSFRYSRKQIDNNITPEAATGIDALVNELKSNRVKLRRNRRKTRVNKALEEMFQVLEISQQQNRNSITCINLNSTA